MEKNLTSMGVMIVLFLVQSCFADTFTHKVTGESFNGYAIKLKMPTKKTRVFTPKGSVEIDIKDYDIERNYAGRRNKVFVIPIPCLIESSSVTSEIEKAILTASNSGALFII